MPSTILIIAARFLSPTLLLMSLVVLYRGHNLPGGGFIGGLMAASAVLLHVLAHGWKEGAARLRPDPLILMIAGLIIAAGSGLPGLFAGQDFMTGEWFPTLRAPLLGKVKLGTPLLFDLGVYLVVIGFTLKCARSLGEEETK